jgi:L-2,4-diaminobutyric acid acetyltransferase
MDTRNDLLLNTIEFRAPLATDGDALNRLLGTTPVLDGNSVQCTLLQCGHFAKTSAAAFYRGKLVGFVSAYYPPNEPHTLFVWQVVVAQSLRDLGLGKLMLHWLIEQPSCANAKYMVTAIGVSNTASWSLFDSFARDIGALPVKSFVTHLDQAHRQSTHEYLLRIAPLPHWHEETMPHHLDDLRAGSMHLPAMSRWLD